MKQKSFDKVKPFCKGFTLVELSIVMIIIGLLIGGIFGGMKLVDNANVQKAVQDLKAIESATLTFRDTFRALPGDIRNPATRIPNCTEPPCSFGGNQNRIVGTTVVPPPATLSPTTGDERFLFWHHLQASDLLQLDMNASTDPEFGLGQPLTSVGAGMRLFFGWVSPRHSIALTSSNAAEPSGLGSLTHTIAEAIDRKMDDGMPITGKIVAGWNCSNPSGNPSAIYVASWDPNNGCALSYINLF